MAEESNQQKREYIKSEDLVEIPSFKSSNKAGYVEDGVDVWAKDVRVKYTSLANEYNSTIHELDIAENENLSLKEQVEKLSETNDRLVSSKNGDAQAALAELEATNSTILNENEALKVQNAELTENYRAVYERNAELEAAAESDSLPTQTAQPVTVQSYDRDAAREDGYTYELTYTAEGNVATVREFPGLTATGKNAEHALSELMDLVDDRVEALIAEGQAVPGPGEYTVTPVEPVTVHAGTFDEAKANAIFAAASEEAAATVKRTQERMFRLEQAAQAEAVSIVEEAHEDAAASRAEAVKNREESKDIRDRMVLLLESQLSEIRATEGSVGYSLTVSEDARELKGQK